MIDRRRAICLAAAAAPLTAACLLLPTSAFAQQAFERFLPLLVDLPGWTGAKPLGTVMEIPGFTVVSAARTYQRGEAVLTVQVVLGPAAEVGGNIDAGDTRTSASTIDGMAVGRRFTVHDKSGELRVVLGPRAMFSLIFNGVSEDEALTLAMRFDWKALQAAS